MATAPVASNLIWGDLDQESLDRAYDQSAWVSNIAAWRERLQVASAASRGRMGEPETHAYGPTPIETFDFYAPKKKTPGPLVICIHGGAWRNGAATHFAIAAEPFVKAGAAAAVLDFVSVDNAGGNLYVIIDQLRRAINHIVTNAAKLGFDPERIAIMGHSSGAHLAATLLTTNWKVHGLAIYPFQAGLLLSGMYDLEPVRRSKRSAYVSFTDNMVADLSPIRHLDQLFCPVVLANGTLESPEFIRQSADMDKAVRTKGGKAELIVCEATNHFEMVERLAAKKSPLAQRLLDLVGLG